MSTETPQIPDHESVKPEGLFDRLIQFSIHNAIWVMLFIAAWIALVFIVIKSYRLMLYRILPILRCRLTLQPMVLRL